MDCTNSPFLPKFKSKKASCGFFEINFFSPVVHFDKLSDYGAGLSAFALLASVDLRENYNNFLSEKLKTLFLVIITWSKTSIPIILLTGLF